MATQLQLRKGTKVQNDMFTGAEAELTYDSTSKDLRIHDGVQQGGYEVPVLVLVQRPTAANNYTWARVWSDGWVEQGGVSTTANDTFVTINLPITMADTNYTVQKTCITDNNTTLGNISFRTFAVTAKTTTSFQTFANQHSTGGFNWQVSGMRA